MLPEVQEADASPGKGTGDIKDRSSCNSIQESTVEECHKRELPVRPEAAASPGDLGKQATTLEKEPSTGVSPSRKRVNRGSVPPLAEIS